MSLPIRILHLVNDEEKCTICEFDMKDSIREDKHSSVNITETTVYKDSIYNPPGWYRHKYIACNEIKCPREKQRLGIK